MEWLDVASKILPFIAFLYTVIYNMIKDKHAKEKAEYIERIRQLEKRLEKREKRRTSRKGKRR